MPVGEVFTIIQTVASSVTGVVKGIKTVTASIEELKPDCNIGLFQSTKGKLADLKAKLNNTQGKVDTLEKTVLELETTVSLLKQKVNTEFPQLKSLVVSYSEVKKDVAVAGALANKAAEIIRIKPDIAPIYIFSLSTPTRSEHTRITANLENLPAIDTEAFGVIREKLMRIGILIRDMERMCTLQRDISNSDINANRVAEIFQEVFENYAGIETKLSELLNRKILKDFDPVFQ